MFAEIVFNRKRTTLLDIIKKNVRPGSIIISDCWASYNTIQKDLDMGHMTVDHSKNFKDPLTGAYTNTIEVTWHDIKMKIPNRERIIEKVDNYLFELLWKKENENNKWGALLKCLAKISYH